MLSFYLHIDSSETTTSIAYDKLTVSLGSITLATYSNLNKASGYILRSFNVAGFAGQTVTLKFSGVEDFSLQTSFVIDDTALNRGLSTSAWEPPRRRGGFLRRVLRTLVEPRLERSPQHLAGDSR